MSEPRKLNVGCGRDVREGWVNLNDRPESVMMFGRDIIGDVCAPISTWRDVRGHEFLRPTNSVYDDWFYDIEASHVIEHVPDVLAMMSNLWRVAKPGCKLVIRCPYGSTDDAFEDPTHVRQMFLGSFGYYSQPFYWKADYGYRGDWQPERIELRIFPEYYGYDDTWLDDEIRRSRNVVQEMVCYLTAVKPARAPERELQVPPTVHILRE